MADLQHTSVQQATERVAEGKPALTAEFLTLALGFSSYLACSVISSAPVLLSLPSFNTGVPDADTIATLFRVALLAIAAILYFKLKRSAQRWVIIGAGVAYAAGIFFAHAPIWLGETPSAVIFLGTLIRGFHILLFLFWLDYLVHFDIRFVAVVTAIGYGVSYLIFAVMTQFDVIVVLQTLVVLPVLSGIALASLPKPSDSSLPTPDAGTTLMDSLRYIPWKQFFGIGLFGVAVPFMMNITSRDAANYNAHTVSLLLALFAILFAVLLWLPQIKHRTLLLYRFTMPALIVTTFVLYLFQDGNALETIIMEACWVFYRTMATTSWCLFTQRSGMCSGFVLAMSQLVLTLCTFLRYVVNSVALALAWPSITILSIVAIVVVFVSAFMLSENDYRDVPSSFVTGHVTEGEKVAAAVAVAEVPTGAAGAMIPAARTAAEAPLSQLEAFARLYRLSPQETTVCDLVLQGKSSAQIAEELFIAPSTLKVHFRTIYQKADVHSKQELINLIHSL